MSKFHSKDYLRPWAYGVGLSGLLKEAMVRLCPLTAADSEESVRISENDDIKVRCRAGSGVRSGVPVFLVDSRGALTGRAAAAGRSQNGGDPYWLRARPHPLPPRDARPGPAARPQTNRKSCRNKTKTQRNAKHTSVAISVQAIFGSSKHNVYPQA